MFKKQGMVTGSELATSLTLYTMLRIAPCHWYVHIKFLIHCSKYIELNQL